ncbi:hypothetical protein J587_0272 [Acinetobacter baumannii 144107]|uniref:hypothetical protein n=1 Tax=Acinetobacter baumannii TaxID=470 RepID=UPI00044BFD15|nr:hypothetical protein [Acinetobacter baumannii]EXE75028.1 hypothetical protein J587_0272 [Acinetobacter baumannii 144107]MDC4354301.1 hypothetical protein [Acinetobacter baumannii]MDF9673292.1 hypothetical protein [Acinetobacter baumannii]MDF9688084.1 hypothetical protein [Acinetobacter baumannii]
MAVPEQTPFIEYTANGTTTVYPLTFDCDKSEYLIVSLDGEEAPVGSWSLTGGSITFNSAPANGVLITIERNTPFRRTTEYQSYNNSFRPSAVNKDFDLIWWKLQELGVADWILSNRINDLRAYVDDKDDELRNYLLNAIQEQGVALDQLEEYYSYLMQQLAQVAIDRGWAASFIVSADGSTQQQVNDRIGNTWYAKPLGYELNARVMLTNGDIVRSTVANNTTDPNVDMTGWVLDNASSQIIDADGNPITIKPIPDFSSTETYIEGSLVIKDGLLQKLTGGVWRPKDPTYYDFGAKIDGVTDDTAAFIAYHTQFKYARLPKGRMLLSSIDLDQFKNIQSVGLIIEGAGAEQSYFDFTGALGFYSSSNTFFRDFNLKNLQIKRKADDKVGIGIYIGSGGAEQINFENVTYRGWLIGRATHTWNSSMKDETFRYCKYPFSQHGTSTNISNPYAVQCTSPYMLGYQCTSAGVLSVPAIPYAYSMLSGFAADDCGLDGSVYKFGRCSGITAVSMSCERPKGAHIFDFEEMVNSSYSNVIIDNYSMYVTTADTALLGLIKKPLTPSGNVIFNNLKISSDKEIYLVSGDGSGIQFVNPQMNDRAFSRISNVPALGLRVNHISYGQDTRQVGELGLSLGANSLNYARVKNRKGKVLIDATTQKLVIYGGLLSEGLTQGLMTVANITVNPISKSGNNAGEKAGTILISSAMDYNASDMSKHLKTVLTGTLTNLTTVTRNTNNTTHLQFDVVIEVSSPSTRHLLDIDLTYNGIANPSGIAWEIQSK